MLYFFVPLAISVVICGVGLAVILPQYFKFKKESEDFQKELFDWKEGRKKTLFEQAGIYPPETLSALVEENRLLHQNNISLSEELEKYKKLYSDEVFRRIVLTDALKRVEDGVK